MGEYHEYESDWFGQNLQISDENPIGKKMYDVEDTMWIGFDDSALHIIE